MSAASSSAGQRGGRPHRIVTILVFAVLLTIWELVAHSVPKSPLRDSPIVPPIEFIFGRSFLGMSDYWKLEWLAPVPELGGEPTYLAAILALTYHSAITAGRVVGGLAIGLAIGISLGVLVSLSPICRKLLALPIHFIRMVPLLALIPLFSFWFGATHLGAIVYIGYGVGVVYFVATINAVLNISPVYLQYARTLGIGRWRTIWSVVIPAIVPELFSAGFVTLGVAWVAAIGAEYIGVDSGIGRMVIWAEFFSHTGRMMFVTILIVLYALATFRVLRVVQRRALTWMPN